MTTAAQDVLVLSTSPLHQRAARFLREACSMHRIDPPSVADILEWASVAFDVHEDPIDPQDWLTDYIDARENAAGARCQAIFGMLDRFARLDDQAAQAVADDAEDARFTSPCDPRVLVMVTHHGHAIVADLAGGHVGEYASVLPWRERRQQRRRERRATMRDRRLRGAA